MRQLVTIMLAFAVAGCANGTLSLDEVTPPADARWVVEHSGGPDLFQVGDAAGRMLATGREMEWALERGNSSWFDVEEMLYYQCGPCKSPGSTIASGVHMFVLDGVVQMSDANAPDNYIPLALDVAMHSVWSDGGSEAWAVGAGGAAWHWNGVDWKSFDTGTESTLNVVHGDRWDNVWAAGEDGTISHFDGENWWVERQLAGVALNDIEVLSNGTVLVVGDNATVLRRNQ